MLVMGIDPSLTSTAVVVLDEQGTVVDAPSLRPRSKGVARLVELDDQFRQVLPAGDDLRLVVLEGYALGQRNALTLAGQAEWVGIIKLRVAELRGPELIEVAPARMKKFVANGRAQKDEIRLAVWKRYGFEHHLNDVVDAYALAQLGRAVLGLEARLTKAQREVVQAIRRETGVQVPA